jgi:hypothetical protein
MAVLRQKKTKVKNMSMVSIKNFISPFTNTVHAVTIILVTVLFALFRLQGGGISTASGKGKPAYDRKIEIPTNDLLESGNTENDAALNRLIKAPPANLPEIKAPEKPIGNSGSIPITGEEEDLLKEMIGKKPLVDESAKPLKKDTKKDTAPGLSDIEKSLGMR